MTKAINMINGISYQYGYDADNKLITVKIREEENTWVEMDILDEYKEESLAVIIVE